MRVAPVFCARLAAQVPGKDPLLQYMCEAEILIDAPSKASVLCHVLKVVGDVGHMFEDKAV